jgi:probable HAF family extracellular repeat protein
MKLSTLGLLALIAPVCGILAGQIYSIADLGPGVANDINNLGHVVGDSGYSGFYYNGETRMLFTNLISEIYPPWVPGGAGISLSTWTTAVAINDLDEIVGMRNRSVGFPDVAFVYPHITTNIGSAIQLERYDMTVTDINNSGRITGYFNVGDRTAIYVSYILGGGTQVDVGEWSQLYAINDSGVAAGTQGTPMPPAQGGFYPGRAVTVSAGGTPTLIDNRATPASSIAYGINDAGVAVGWMTSQPDAPRHAFRSTGSGLEDLGTLGGTNSVANDINASGVIVGNAELSSGVTHAFYYSDETMIDLNSLVPAGSGWELLSANAVNNRGEVVGQGRFQGELRAYKLSPLGLTDPPIISTNPAGARLALGASHTFTVSATGVAPFTYQWTLNGTNIANATNSTYIISAADAFSAGEYRALVTNAGGTVASLIARIDVLDPELAGVQLFGVKIGGAIGATYRVEFRPSAGASTWTTLTNVTLTASPQLWVDLQSVDNAHRIYRAVRLP